MKNRHLRIAIAAVVLIVLWQIAAFAAQAQGEYASRLIPSWSIVFADALPGFATFHAGGVPNYPDALYVLTINALITVRRVLLGLLIGAATGVATGLLIGLQPTLRATFYPVVRLLRNIPLLALIALFLVWFGGSEQGIIIYIAFGLWIIYSTNTIEAVTHVDKVLVNFSKTLGASTFTVYKSITLPLIVPSIINATKVALGVAWAIALGGEFLAAQDGLGRLLIVSQQYLETGRMLVILILFVLLTTFFGWVVDLIGRRLTRWMPTENRRDAPTRKHFLNTEGSK